MTICSFDTHICITKSGTLYVSQTFTHKKIIYSRKRDFSLPAYFIICAIKKKNHVLIKYDILGLIQGGSISLFTAKVCSLF